MLTATLASTTIFPQRELGLWTSSPMTLSPAQVHVSENGQVVTGLHITPLSHPARGQFGVIVVLDESAALTPSSRELELASARAIAAKRTGNQELGVVSSDGRPEVMLPLTSDPQLIDEGLGAEPLVGPGTSVPSALSLAYAQLRQAGIAAGGVILITATHNVAIPAAESAVARAGLKLGYQTFSVEMGSHIGGIWSWLTRGYLASYRSSASPGQPVTVSLAVDGVAGRPAFQYTASQHPASPGFGPPPTGSLGHFPPLQPHPGFAQVPHLVAGAGSPPSARSFWSSPASMVLVAVCCALLLAAAVWLLVGGVGRSEVERRVANFIPDPQAGQDPDSVLSVGAPGVPAILARRRWWPTFALQVDVANFRRSAVALVKLAVSGSLLAAVLLTLLLGSLAGAVVGLAVGPLVLYVVLRRAVRRRRTRFSDQLPSSLQDMAGAVRGGRSLAGSLAAVMDGADQPLLGEFERAVADDQLGRPLEVSLRTIAERMQSEDMEQVALVAALHRRSGSSVAEALDHVAAGARERSELIRELKSLTGQARLSSRILTGLPLVLFGALSLIEPSYMHPLLHTPGGIAVTVLCAVMVSVGWLAMRRIIKVEA